MSIRTKKCTRTGIRRPRIRQAKYKGLSIIVPQTRGHNSDSEQIISDPIPEITAPWLRPTIRKNTHHIVAEQRMKQLELDDLIEFRGNQMKIWINVHNAWHFLFDTMVTDEVIMSIKLFGWRPTTRTQEEAWYILFGTLNIEEIEEHIQTMWSVEYINPFMHRRIMKLLHKRNLLRCYQPVGEQSVITPVTVKAFAA